MKKTFKIQYKDIISLENLLEAWQEFLKGKKNREDVQIFSRNLMGNIIKLHNDLLSRSYSHSKYQAFNISDPKPRNIHKASVRDRLLHHAIYRSLYSYFDKKFIPTHIPADWARAPTKRLKNLRAWVEKYQKTIPKPVGY